MTTIYLTFDDGPRLGTDDVLSVLHNKRVPATLFMIGAHVDTAWMRGRLKDAQCSRTIEIANHSMTHAGRDYAKFYANPAGVLQDFKSANPVLGLTGGSPILARLPGHNTWRLPGITVNDGNTAGAADLLFGAGFHVYGWDVEWKRDNGGLPTDSPSWVCQKIALAVRIGLTEGTGEVVLLTHDPMFRASTGGRAKLVELIDRLMDAGYDFDVVSNYRGRRGGARLVAPL